jgi:predicted DNA-binding transcriptional regulator YafY
VTQKIIYERFLWFHDNVKSGNCPNARTLSQHFEISRKTAQRDIEFMRDRLRAPLGFDRGRRGYIYEDNTWELPGFWMKEKELTSLLVAYRLASAIPDSTLKESFKSFLNQALAKSPHALGITIDDLKDKVSIKNIEYSETSDTVFRLALEALLFSRSLAIDYYSPHNGQSTARHILPLHLLHYSGTWHLIAWCGLKEEIRDFVLSRISAVTLSTKRIRPRLPSGSIKA